MPQMHDLFLTRLPAIISNVAITSGETASLVGSLICEFAHLQFEPDTLMPDTQPACLNGIYDDTPEKCMI